MFSDLLISIRLIDAFISLCEEGEVAQSASEASRGQLFVLMFPAFARMSKGYDEELKTAFLGRVHLLARRRRG